jgi:hypothetical protein
MFKQYHFAQAKPKKGEEDVRCAAEQQQQPGYSSTLRLLSNLF